MRTTSLLRSNPKGDGGDGVETGRRYPEGAGGGVLFENL